MKNSKKLIGAIAALVIALAVSVGSTFAWFTTNKKVAVDNIQATVTTGSTDLQVRRVKKDGTAIGDGEWSYGLIFDEDEFDNVKLDALTSADKGKTLTGKPNLTTPSTAGDKGIPNYKADGTKDTDKTANYIELYLEFRSTAAETIVLDATSAVTGESKGDDVILAWKDDSSTYGTAINKGAAIASNAKNAVRVSIGKVASSEETVVGVWNPNATEGYFKGNLAQDYELYQDAQFNSEKNKEAINTIYTDPGYDAITTGTGATDLVTLGNLNNGYYYAVICVKIWLEGTDGDCFNNIFDDSILAKLVFSIKETV